MHIPTNLNSSPIATAKKVIWKFHQELEDCKADVDEIDKVLQATVSSSSDYVFRSVYPWRDQLCGSRDVAQRFWEPLKKSFRRMQRRCDIFIAGYNSLHGEEEAPAAPADAERDSREIWVLSMGHFMGLFDQDWLGIRHTRQLAALRYAEFSQVDATTGKILQTNLFLDIVGLMQAVGMNPLPPSTGAYLNYYPGPRTHDGVMLESNGDPQEGVETQALVDRMVEDLSSINNSFTCDADLLRKTWTEDMMWYGPAGIGATYTIPRYQQQHQLPFRAQLAKKEFHGHQVRIAEGNYAAFFGWPMNLTNTPTGGFLGLPQSIDGCPMQVVDVYRRQGDKLAENWIFIDLLWYLKHQGVDILERTVCILNPTAGTHEQQNNDEDKEMRKHKEKVDDAPVGGEEKTCQVVG